MKTIIPPPNLGVGVVDTNQIANGAVTTVKIADGAVTTDKLADDSVSGNKIIDLAVGTSKLRTDAVTTVKLADGVLAADVAGRAKMDDDFFDAGTVAAKFSEGIARWSGVIGSARLRLATAPTADDDVPIGGHVYKFVANGTLGPQVVETQIELSAPAVVATDRANLIDAINLIVNPAIVPGSGAQPRLFADLVDTDKVRVRTSDVPGGSIKPTNVSIPVSTNLTSPADRWNCDNTNLTGRNQTIQWYSTGKVEITTEMIAAGEMNIELPFSPIILTVSVYDSSGVPITVDQAVRRQVLGIQIRLAAGGPPHFAVGDILHFVAIS